jgi:hypothetical protein
VRPKEFISRALSLMDFGSFPKPDSFNSAALAVSMMSKSRTRFEVNGYSIFIQAQMCLEHVVMLVEMSDDKELLVGASICFTFQQCDLNNDPPDEDHIYESWRLPERHMERIDRIMEVLTFLTLKTTPIIVHKVSRT